jgi:hypothetical protein
MEPVDHVSEAHLDFGGTCLAEAVKQVVDDGHGDLGTWAPSQLRSPKTGERANGLGVDRQQLSVGRSPRMRLVDGVGQSSTDVNEKLPWLLGA